MIDSHTLQRLAFIRYGFLVASEQSQQPEPMSAYSLLGFHDSVELFLQLVAEHLDVGKNKTQFMEYWDLIAPALSSQPLSQQTAMKRLNNARIALKHHGNLPSTTQVDQFRAITGSFFEDNTLMVFGVRFDEVSLIDLVPYEEPRETLKMSEAAMNQGDTEQAMSNIAMAFEQLISEVNQGYLARYHRSPFYFGASFTFDSAFFRRRTEPIANPEREAFEDKLVKAVESLQSAVKILSLGLDYRKFARFSLLTPVVKRTLGGDYIVQAVQGSTGSIDWPPSLEACRFCLDFVIESAVRMRGTDISLISSTTLRD